MYVGFISQLTFNFVIIVRTVTDYQWLIVGNITDLNLDYQPLNYVTLFFQVFTSLGNEINTIEIAVEETQ